MDFRICALALLALCATSRAQDSRTVTEPVMPPSCAVLAPAAAASDDGARIQAALDRCAMRSGVSLAIAFSTRPPFPAATRLDQLTTTQQ